MANREQQVTILRCMGFFMNYDIAACTRWLKQEAKQLMTFICLKKDNKKNEL